MTILLLIKNVFKTKPHEQQHIRNHHNRHLDLLARSPYHHS
ncbi:hypothetical protein [Pseudalkalibacillus hwajinpoensis]|nr:hypothetical protein [Pseudalkalibacillus hwajinpoensis]